MEKIIIVDGKERFYYGSYNSIDKALMVARAYKNESKYTIRKRTTPILVSDKFDLYLSNVSPLSNGVIILG
jgi:hypothetical protein